MWVKLARASSTFGKLTFRHIATFGLTTPQFGVLEVLGHLGPLTLSELSHKRLVSGGNITCVVDNLEKEGLVARTPSATDRRAIVVNLTPKGQTLFNEVFAKHAKFVESIAAVLSEQEQRQLSTLLRKLGLGLRERYSSQLG